MAIPIGTLSYAAAAAAFLFLSLLLMTSWRGRLQGMLLALASLITALWAAAKPTSPTRFTGCAAGRTARGYAQRGVVRFPAGAARLIDARRCGRCGSLPRDSPFFAWSASSTADRAPSALGRKCSSMLSHLVLRIIGMVLVEQLYRNVHPQQRWGIKFLCLGLGGMFACDFYLYSRHPAAPAGQSRHLGRARRGQRSRRSAGRRCERAQSRVVARHLRVAPDPVSFHGDARRCGVSAGDGCAGYYIRYFGGSWGRVLQVTFLFGAVLLLFVILFSGTLRARLKVFLSKNFFSYQLRLPRGMAALHPHAVGREPGVRLRECSIQAVAELVDSPGGALLAVAGSGRFRAGRALEHAVGEGVIEPADQPVLPVSGTRQWVIVSRGV